MVATDIVLESDVPGKIFECNLRNVHPPFDVHLCLIQYLLIGHKVAYTLTDLEDFCFIEVQTLKCITGVFKDSCQLQVILFFPFGASRIVVPIEIRDGTVPCVSFVLQLYPMDDRIALFL